MNNNQKKEKLNNFLEMALSFEDQMSGSIYTEYSNRQAWPENLDEEVFVVIRDSLVKIINDTKRHKDMIKTMMRQQSL